MFGFVHGRDSRCRQGSGRVLLDILIMLWTAMGNPTGYSANRITSRRFECIGKKQKDLRAHLHDPVYLEWQHTPGRTSRGKVTR